MIDVSPILLSTDPRINGNAMERTERIGRVAFSSRMRKRREREGEREREKGTER